VNSERLLSSPETALREITSDLALTIDDHAIAEIVSGPFRRNSKSGQAFDKRTRDAEYGAAAAAHGDEISKVVVWARAVADAAGVAIAPEDL
jgi:hypothetical protein